MNSITGRFGEPVCITRDDRVQLCTNPEGWSCGWCPDSLPAPWTVTGDASSDGICPDHVLMHFPGLYPPERRDVRGATEFRMLVISSYRRNTRVGEWEHFADLDSMHRAVREITGSAIFENRCASTTGHYDATGHLRVAVARGWDTGRGARGHVVVHTVVR